MSESYCVRASGRSRGTPLAPGDDTPLVRSSEDTKEKNADVSSSDSSDEERAVGSVGPRRESGYRIRKQPKPGFLSTAAGGGEVASHHITSLHFTSYCALASLVLMDSNLVDPSNRLSVTRSGLRECSKK